jgi:hypothetical protein
MNQDSSLAIFEDYPVRRVNDENTGPQMTNEVLTIKEVVVLLNFAKKTVYAMDQVGKNAGFKIRQWRIKRAERERWCDAQLCGGDGGRNGE